MRPHRMTPRSAVRAAIGLGVVPLLAASTLAPAAADPGGEAPRTTLREAAPEGFKIGTAVAGGGHHLDQDYPDPFPNDEEYREILAAEFNSVSPENQMKWEFIHPEKDVYDFGPADAIVEFAQQNGQVVRGHTLLWHSQNPAWLEEGDFSKRELRAILKDHIQTVVGRYKGKIQQWDVVNEVVRDDGTGLRTEDNIWIRELGPGIIADAFRWAHAADPEAKLYVNDYGVESIGPKSDAYYEGLQILLDQGVPVDGFSVQGHLSTRYGFPGDLEANLQRFDDLGLETAITEIDVRMDLPDGAAPTEAQLAQQADYYDRALRACLGVDECGSYTVWGFTDKYSWVPVFFSGQGSATIMTEDFERKPAYDVIRATLAEARGDGQGAGQNPGATAEIVTATRSGGDTVALTFDDGPDPEDTPALLEVLREHRAQAVFCLWGEHVQQHPEIVREIVADGHVLCNHSMRHQDMSTWTPEQVRADLEATSAAIHEAAPGAEILYFRAPYGAWGQSAAVAAELDLQPLGWTFDVADWEEPGADVIIKRFQERLTPGSVVLLHDGGGDRSGTVEAVDRSLPLLERVGGRVDLPALTG